MQTPKMFIRQNSKKTGFTKFQGNVIKKELLKHIKGGIIIEEVVVA